MNAAAIPDTGVAVAVDGGIVVRVDFVAGTAGGAAMAKGLMNARIAIPTDFWMICIVSWLD